MRLSKLIQDLKIKRHLRMIDQSPILLRSDLEQSLLMNYVTRIQERRERRHVNEYADRIDKEFNAEQNMAYDCPVEEIFKKLNFTTNKMTSNLNQNGQITTNNKDLSFNDFTNAYQSNIANTQSTFKQQQVIGQNNTINQSAQNKRLRVKGDEQVLKRHKSQQDRNKQKNKNMMQKKILENDPFKLNNQNSQSKIKDNLSRLLQSTQDQTSNAEYFSLLNKTDFSMNTTVNHTFQTTSREKPQIRKRVQLFKTDRGADNSQLNHNKDDSYVYGEQDIVSNQQKNLVLDTSITRNMRQYQTERPKSSLTQMSKTTKHHTFKLQFQKKELKRKANIKPVIHFKPNLAAVPALFPKGCLTCGGRNQQVMYHGDRHICSRCKPTIQCFETGKFVDVFLSKIGSIVVLKKQSQNDETTKVIFMREENILLDNIKTWIKENPGKKFKGQTLPANKNLDYGDYMNLKIYNLGCYAALAGDGNLIMLLKDY
ncbi:UNKNOWN [Stylonychia lemnae]|uniref:Uncharacterized protein n=1 Tax=Stylonychia lemnae TaxID=5949 RepID=A0A077ZYJ2_STYLE|nr:UNKNOWN [Stylonychia lemnae]|eukprot:CDW74682.1 UNKNOWN [Stylonychia lemnae]